MKVLMLHTHDLGIGHYRAHAPARALAAAGHDVTYFTSPDGKGDALAHISDKYGDPIQWLFKNVRHYDLVHWGYSTQLWHLELAVALRNATGVPYIVDYDDDLYNVPSYNMAFKQYHAGAPERRVVRFGMRSADAVSVSTAPLRDVFTEKGDGRNIHILPNLHDPSVWQGLTVDPRRANDESIRILFSGGLGRFGDLRLPEIREAVETTMAHFDGKDGRPMVRLFFLGCAPDWAGKWMADASNAEANRAFFLKFAPLNTYFKIWKRISPDIVMNPVECNLFNRSKSAIKGLEAGAVRAAFIGTDHPTHDVLPKDACLKVDNTVTQWVESLEQLVTDESLRHKLAEKLGKWVDSYTYDAHIHHWVRAYEDVIARGALTNDQLYKVLHRVPEGVTTDADSGGRVELGPTVNTQ